MVFENNFKIVMSPASAETLLIISAIPTSENAFIASAITRMEAENMSRIIEDRMKFEAPLSINLVAATRTAAEPAIATRPWKISSHPRSFMLFRAAERIPIAPANSIREKDALTSPFVLSRSLVTPTTTRLKPPMATKPRNISSQLKLLKELIALERIFIDAAKRSIETEIL